MLISKFDLYKNGWLDLVFADRNRSYGAYELRQHNSRVMAQSLGIMVASIIVVAFVFGVILRQPVKAVEKMIPVVVNPNVVIPPPVQPDKPAQPKAPKTPAEPKAPPTQPTATVRFVPPVVKPDADAEKLPSLTELDNKNIGPADTKGPAATGPTVDNGPAKGNDESGSDVVLPIGLEREPQPVGGMAAFGKFISKHLHFPQEAEEAKVGGRVYVSFIVEKDGTLSSFTILRGPGYGTNEEALRVLKLAPAWIPGIQNNHPVRVQYNIPINFQLGDDDSDR